jgi:hypothetical protein
MESGFGGVVKMDRGWKVRLAPAAVAAVSLLPATGCGGDDERVSNLRPPTPVNVAVQIGDERVSVSPKEVGAGPVTITASNQTNASRQLSIECSRELTRSTPTAAGPSRRR